MMNVNDIFKNNLYTALRYGYNSLIAHKIIEMEKNKFNEIMDTIQSTYGAQYCKVKESGRRTIDED